MIKIDKKLYDKICDITGVEYSDILLPHRLYDTEYYLVDDDSITNIFEDLLTEYNSQKDRVKDLEYDIEHNYQQINDEEKCPDCTLDNDRQHIANSIRNGSNW